MRKATVTRQRWSSIEDPVIVVVTIDAQLFSCCCVSDLRSILISRSRSQRRRQLASSYVFVSLISRVSNLFTTATTSRDNLLSLKVISLLHIANVVANIYQFLERRKAAQFTYWPISQKHSLRNIYSTALRLSRKCSYYK